MLVLALFSTQNDAAHTLSRAKRIISAAAEVGVSISAIVTNIPTLAWPGASAALLGLTPPSLKYFDLDLVPANTVALQVELLATHATGIVVVRSDDHATHPAVTAVINGCVATDRILLVASPSHSVTA